MFNLKNYLEGELSDAELEDLSAYMINAKLDRDKKKEWAKKLKQEYGAVQPYPQKLTLFKKYRFHLMSIAASILVILSAIYIYDANVSPPYIKIVDKEIRRLNIMGDQSTFRKGSQKINDIRKKANLAYVSKEYEKSISLWAQIDSIGQATSLDYLYLGICHLQQSDAAPQKAIEFLLKSQSMDGPKEEINWALSLAYLKAMDIEKGKQLMTEIVEQKAYKAAEAERILMIIRD